MVIIKEDPASIYVQHVKKIISIVEQHFAISWGGHPGAIVDYNSLYLYSNPDMSLPSFLGTLRFADNNKDVEIKGDPNVFMEAANEIEKFGYSVTIIY